MPAEPFQADLIEADLADVEVALARLDAGTYWTDEVTGEPLPDGLLAGMIAAIAMSVYGMPVISAMMNAPAPMIGGII